MIQDGYYQGKLANTVYWWEGNCRGAYSSLKQAKAARAANPSFCALPLAPFESDWQLLEPIGQELEQSTSASTGVKVEAPSPKPAGIRGQPATDRRRKLLIL